jgi:hypothetical protein
LGELAKTTVTQAISIQSSAFSLSFGLVADRSPRWFLSRVGLLRLFLGARRAPSCNPSGGQTGLPHDELQNEPDADDQQDGSNAFHAISFGCYGLAVYGAAVSGAAVQGAAVLRVKPRTEN